MMTFRWRVAVGGYLVDGTGDSAVIKPSPDWRYREFSPLVEHTGLFRAFAATPLSPEDFCAFANRYGDLWDGLVSASGSFPKVFPGEEVQQKTVKSWEKEIVDLRCSLEAWDRIRANQVSQDDLPDLLRGANHGVTGKFPAPTFEIDPERGGLRLEPVPGNLLEAIWGQFAQAVNGNKDHRACGHCGDWFELTPEIASKNRYYCTEYCRSAAYRRRRERAVELEAQGMSLSKIAEELGSDAKTVAGWLKRKKS